MLGWHHHVVALYDATAQLPESGASMRLLGMMPLIYD